MHMQTIMHGTLDPGPMFYISAALSLISYYSQTEETSTGFLHMKEYICAITLTITLTTKCKLEMNVCIKDAFEPSVYSVMYLF